MPRKKTHPHWIDRVKALIADAGDASNNLQIVRLLMAEAAAMPPELRAKLRPGPPSDRTVRQIRANTPPSELRQYHTVRWPESFEGEHGASGDLPWEAAPTALELLRYLNMVRPSVRLARLFWRVTQAAPDAPTYARFSAAQQLAEAELGISDDDDDDTMATRRRIERWAATASAASPA